MESNDAIDLSFLCDSDEESTNEAEEEQLMTARAISRVDFLESQKEILDSIKPVSIVDLSSRDDDEDASMKEDDGENKEDPTRQNTPTRTVFQPAAFTRNENYVTPTIDRKRKEFLTADAHETEIEFIPRQSKLPRREQDATSVSDSIPISKDEASIHTCDLNSTLSEFSVEAEMKNLALEEDAVATVTLAEQEAGGTFTIDAAPMVVDRDPPLTPIDTADDENGKFIKATSSNLHSEESTEMDIKGNESTDATRVDIVQPETEYPLGAGFQELGMEEHNCVGQVSQDLTTTESFHGRSDGSAKVKTIVFICRQILRWLWRATWFAFFLYLVLYAMDLYIPEEVEITISLL